jgi:hypothetical protein
MSKEFIPYELAVKLKELGFDEPCLFAFDNCSTPMRCSDLRTNEQKFNGVNYNSSTYTSQPTFSQAFRWFREKYNIQSCVAFTISKYKFEIHFQRLADGENPPVMVWHYVDSWLGLNMGLFDTYEEAEIACLTKLIEIVQGGSHE